MVHEHGVGPVVPALHTDVDAAKRRNGLARGSLNGLRVAEIEGRCADSGADLVGGELGQVRDANRGAFLGQALHDRPADPRCPASYDRAAAGNRATSVVT